MNKVNEYLNKKAEKLMVYKMPRNESLMEEIFNYDPRTLDSTNSENISKYAIGISQFLIYFTSEVNKSKILLMQKKRFIETSIEQSGIVKARSTKAEYRRKVIDSSEELKQDEIYIEALTRNSYDWKFR